MRNAKGRIVIIVGIVLIAAYLIGNYRDEYEQTYHYKELEPADAAAYVPASLQPDGEGMSLYRLPKADGDKYPNRYVFWSKQRAKERGYQAAQLKRSGNGLTINVKPIAVQHEDEVKADLIIEVESESVLEPVLIYADNKKASVKEVTVP
jgi:hypothetical protein